jgi:hypothetical protein
MSANDPQPHPGKPTRKDRLAAKLRENLRRRKAQSRELASRGASGAAPGLSKETERR